MSEFRRRLMMQKSSRLPVGYRECEYLESHGTEYIVIPFAVNNANLMFYSKDNTNLCSIFGAEHDVNNRFTLRFQNNYFGYYGTTAGFQTLVPVPSDGMFNVSFERYRTITVNGLTFTIQFRYSSLNPALFALNYRNTYVSRIKAKVYSFAAIGDTSTIELIPAIDPNGVPCMFDMVSQTPLYNQGTGTFGYKLK